MSKQYTVQCSAGLTISILFRHSVRFPNSSETHSLLDKHTRCNAKQSEILNNNKAYSITVKHTGCTVKHRTLQTVQQN